MAPLEGEYGPARDLSVGSIRLLSTRHVTRASLMAGVAPMLLVIGCATYSPVPKQLPDTAARFAERTVSWQTAAEVCKRLAPQAPCDPVRPDRLLLFSAMLDGNPEVASARARLASAVAGAEAARSRPAANLTLSSEYARDPALSSRWLVGAGLDVPLDAGPGRRARLAEADLTIVAARHDLAETIWTARMALVRGLDRVAMAEQQREVSAELSAVQARRLWAMEQRLSEGEIARAELEQARLDLAEARRREMAATAAREAGVVQIAETLGVSRDHLPKISLRDADAPPIAARIDADARHQALLARSDLLRAMVAYDQAEAAVRTEIAAQYPAISVGPGFIWERGLVKRPFNIGLVLPPFDLNRRNMRAAEAQRSEAGAALEAAYAAAASSVDAALAQQATAERALDQVRRVDLPVARRLDALAERELAAGAIDRTDWAAARSGLLLARLAELDSLSDVLAANAALEEALRRPLSGPETLVEGAAR